MIEKNAFLLSCAIIAVIIIICNNYKRMLLLAAFGVSSCFARRVIELTKNVPGLNRPLHPICRLKKFGKLQRKQVYYVTAVSNDTDYMKRLLLQLNSQIDRQYTNVIIVDMSRPGKEQFNMSVFTLDIEAHYLYLGKHHRMSVLKSPYA